MMWQYQTGAAMQKQRAACTANNLSRSVRWRSAQREGGLLRSPGAG
jgi:hypothetical protein